jgi:hypothetical protein
MSTMLRHASVVYEKMIDKKLSLEGAKRYFTCFFLKFFLNDVIITDAFEC